MTSSKADTTHATEAMAQRCSEKFRRIHSKKPVLELL